MTHFEKVRGPDDEFQNLVAYAGKRSCSVHIAKAGLDKRPAIEFIQRRNPSYAGHIAEYLSDATVLQEDLYPVTVEQDAAEPIRLLVATALAHFLLALQIRTESIPPSVSSPWQEESGGSSLVHEARERVLAAYSDRALSVQLLAEWLRCSADYLSHIYKTQTGESLTAFINRVRLERAAELLNETGLSVKEISWACGFSEESYFIKKFSTYFGLTPSQYRRTGRDLLPSPGSFS
ncbi:AraC family transcriptional regulator [Gracilinema caldarium]|uniref:helix-turn-helix domain-containing protein n=1 Tax=Gracilinema caldarium TaxID=215591 RepID=UPI0026F224A7|nr:helix-turn-helix transcriptional regulator [Gracilinema caldarium]